MIRRHVVKYLNCIPMNRKGPNIRNVAKPKLELKVDITKVGKHGLISQNCVKYSTLAKHIAVVLIFARKRRLVVAQRLPY